MRKTDVNLFFVVLLSLVFWACTRTEACHSRGVPRNTVLDWLKKQVQEGLGLRGPPVAQVQRPHDTGAASRLERSAHAKRLRPHQDTLQIILFPNSDSTCSHTSGLPQNEAPGHSTYYFQPSAQSQESVITSAHFWFYTGIDALSGNASAPLYVLTTEQELIHAAERPAKQADDGWVTYHLAHHIRLSVAQGPFMMQVRCPSCGCHAEASRTPFVHLQARSKGPDRSRRAPVPWSPSAIDLLQRPAQESPNYEDCHRQELNISFADLGWDNWIVHPKVFTFYYCHGNCSSRDRMTTALGIKQCCAPVPGTMKSLRVRTTSDGGYSFKYETLPNIIAEDCTCI